MSKKDRYIEIERVEHEKGIIRIVKDVYLRAKNKNYILQFKAKESINYSTVNSYGYPTKLVLNSAQFQLKRMAKCFESLTFNIISIEGEQRLGYNEDGIIQRE
jgi:hypothetical protein